jgi:hypothetical protein
MSLAIHGEIIAGSGCTLLARLLDNTGNPLQPTEVASINVTVFDMSTSAVITEIVPTVTAVLNSTVTTGPMWNADSTGYNFTLPMPGTAFLTGGTSYQVVVAVTPIMGSPTLILFNLECDSVY